MHRFYLYASRVPMGGILKSPRYAVFSRGLEFIKETVGSCHFLHKWMSWAEVFKAARRCESSCCLASRTVISRCHTEIWKIWRILYGKDSVISKFEHTGVELTVPKLLQYLFKMQKIWGFVSFEFLTL